MPTQKKGCDDDEIVDLFSPQRRLFRKSKAAVLFRAKVSYRLMYILHESAMTPTHSSLGILSTRFRQPQVKSDDKVQHNCFNSFVVIQLVQSILHDGVWMFSLLCE